MPSGVTFTDNGDGTATISGTPAAGTGGSYPLTIKASNGVNPDAQQSFTLTVTQIPTITSANHATFAVGSAGSFTVTTTAGHPTATTLTKTGSMPSGVTFTDNGDGTATISGTPAAGTGGNYPLTITATNSAGAAQQSFTLTVNQPPAITSADHTTFAVGSAGSFTVTTTAGHPTATTLTKTGSMPSGVTFTDNGDGTATISGTPAAGTGGSYPLTIKASNGVNPDAQQSFTLTVTQIPTITSANHATFAVGSAGSFTVTTTAGHPTATTLTKTGSMPSGVTFTDNGDGTATISGTPAAGTGGNYPLTITATNSAGAAQQSFTLTVNQPPAISTDPSPQNASVGDTVSFSAAATGFPTPTVKWQRSTNGGASFSDVPGATADTYSFTAAAGQSGDRYRAVFTNTVNSATSSAAALTLTPRTLTVATAGNGGGTVSAAGIDCGAPGHTDCSETVPDGTQITLTAHPTANSDFAGFSGGGCAGVGATCTVSMNAAKSVTATFRLKRHSLTVTRSGSGSGSISSSPAGIDCPGTCGGDFDEGETVTSSADPDPGPCSPASRAVAARGRLRPAR